MAYEGIRGFSVYGPTLTDTFHGNRLLQFLHRQYRGGPIVIGSARFHQGNARNDWIPISPAACGGPTVETIFSLGDWLTRRGFDGPNRIAFFTPGTTFAETVGPKAATKLLEMANQKLRPRGFGSSMANKQRRNSQSCCRIGSPTPF